MNRTSTKSERAPRLSIPVRRFELGCGAVLLVSPRPSAPITAVQVHVRGGPSRDPAGLEGSAFLTGALADQGTRQRSEEEIAALLEPEGGEISGDAGGLSGSIVNSRWKLLVDLLTEMITSSAYPEAEVARQKQRLLDRLVLERDDPRVQGGLLFRRLVYGNHWLGRPSRGTLESLPRIRAKDLRAFRRENWLARRAVIGVCGDLDPVEVFRVFEKRLARWPAGGKVVPEAPRWPQIARRSGAFTAERQQVHLYLGHLGIARKDPDYAPLVVMDHVLGTGPGFTNRISRKLRDELGLAYAVSANIHASAGLLPGTFTAYIGTSPKNAATATRGFVEEIRRVQRDLVEDHELDVAKSFLLGSFPLGFERAARRASYAVSAELHGFPEDHLDRLLRDFAAVTAEDVRRVARTHLFPEQSCLAAAGPIRATELRRILPAKPPRLRPVPDGTARRSGRGDRRRARLP